MRIEKSLKVGLPTRILVVVASIPFLLIGLLYIFGAIIMWPKEKEMRKDAAKNEQQLTELTILNSQITQAEGKPNGDFITWSSSPALAVFYVDKSLKELKGEVEVNLDRQGFKINKSFKLGYKNTYDEISEIRFWAAKEQNLVVYNFEFAEPISCKREGKVNCSDATNMFDLPLFNMRKVDRMKVYYDDYDDLSYLTDSY